MNPSEIKAIIFDLGGVFLNVDVQITALEIAKLLKKETDLFFKSPDFKKIFDIIEANSSTAEEIREGYFKHFNFKVPQHDFDTAYCALLLDFPQPRYNLIKKLQNKLPLYLLSNTNAIHQKVFEDRFRTSFNGEELGSLFIESYYSHLMKDYKPKESIYRTVLSNSNLDPATTLFIDDNEKNIEGAKNVGLLTYYLRVDQGEDLCDIEVLKKI